MDYSKIIEAVSKITSFESVIVIGLLILGYVYYHNKNNDFKWKNFLVFSASLFGVLLFGAFITLKKLKFSEKEMTDLKNKYENVINIRDSLKLTNQKNEILKDSCQVENRKILTQVDSLIDRKQYWKNLYQNESKERKMLSRELKKYTGHKYKYCNGYALVRDPETGFHGYHKKGTTESSIKYIYNAGTKFSEGRAFVKYNGSKKWGIIDESLGKPISNCIFEYPFAYSGGKASVIFNGKRIFIDKSGNKTFAQ